MLGFFKRHAKQIKSDLRTTDTIPVDSSHNNRYLDAQTARVDNDVRSKMRQNVQLFLHRQRLFPSEIDATEEWSEVTFYASNPQYNQAAIELRALQREGTITVQEPLQWHGYNGWTARVRVND